MQEEIVNRVALSKLMVVDLEDYYPEGERVQFDIKDWLHEGFVLREKEFRAQVAAYDWSQHKDQFVALTCTADAIIPAWAYMLITMEISAFARKVSVGDLQLLETAIYQDIINALDVTPYQDKPLIVKGCSHKPVPPNAYIMLSAKLRPIAKSIMYGEACSSVPLYKRK
ncbi:DUF2480 family protein [Sediminibacter sp. Hel_I_10]|uniref:DUF2480 family protein n=1 Tax=Sediminibacter sp. Hel_I_10 TaxID=1392490 RepID=UPI000479DD62|nr:DUF2480 family protein [Sediminibacter sp. Hel_I_10]